MNNSIISLDSNRLDSNNPNTTWPNTTIKTVKPLPKSIQSMRSALLCYALLNSITPISILVNNKYREANCSLSIKNFIIITIIAIN